MAKQVKPLTYKEILRRLSLIDEWTKQVEAVQAIEMQAIADNDWLTPHMQRELVPLMMTLLKSERSALVKEAVGAVNSIASSLKHSLLPFAIGIFRDLLLATGTGELLSVCTFCTHYFGILCVGTAYCRQ